MYTNHQDSVVSFCVDRAGETIRVNVYYDKAVVGIMFSHPRMGQTQSFRYQVDLSELRKIFRDPRVHTGDGYSNMKKKQKKPNPKSYLTSQYAVGELVNVKGYPDAVITGAPRWPGDMAKIRFADGSDYRVETSRLTHVDRLHPCGCKNLAAEAEMQLERLDHELQRIMKEREQCKQILELQHAGGSSSFAGSPKRDGTFLNSYHPDPRALSSSPRAVIGAFEPYNPNQRNNSGSIWSSGSSSSTAYLGNGTPSTILPPYFPVNH